MASVYKVVNGKKIQKLIAQTSEVQRGLDEEVLKAHSRAEVLMDRHHQTYRARVTLEEGRIDRYLVLENEGDPNWSAYDIEVGHYMGKRSKGDKRPWVEGIWVLHDAVGLPHKERGGK